MGGNVVISVCVCCSWKYLVVGVCRGMKIIIRCYVNSIVIVGVIVFIVCFFIVDWLENLRERRKKKNISYVDVLYYGNFNVKLMLLLE